MVYKHFRLKVSNRNNSKLQTQQSETDKETLWSGQNSLFLKINNNRGLDRLLYNKIIKRDGKNSKLGKFA